MISVLIQSSILKNVESYPVQMAMVSSRVKVIKYNYILKESRRMNASAALLKSKPWVSF